MANDDGTAFRLRTYAPKVTADTRAIFIALRVDNRNSASVPITAVSLLLPSDDLEVRAFPFSTGRPPAAVGMWARPEPRFLSADIDRDAPDAPRAVGVDPVDDRPLDRFRTEVPGACTLIRWVEFRLGVPADALVMKRRRILGELAVVIAGQRITAPVSVRVETRRDGAARHQRIGAML
jgi:hypothetical protein